jgi:hypothetical protein
MYSFDRDRALPVRMMVFSLIALAIGVIHVIGTARRWAAMDPALDSETLVAD